MRTPRHYRGAPYPLSRLPKGLTTKLLSLGILLRSGLTWSGLLTAGGVLRTIVADECSSPPLWSACRGSYVFQDIRCCLRLTSSASEGSLPRPELSEALPRVGESVSGVRGLRGALAEPGGVRLEVSSISAIFSWNRGEREPGACVGGRLIGVPSSMATISSKWLPGRLYTPAGTVPPLFSALKPGGSDGGSRSGLSAFASLIFSSSFSACRSACALLKPR